MIPTELEAARICLQTSKPSMPGIITSKEQRQNPRRFLKDIQSFFSVIHVGYHISGPAG